MDLWEHSTQELVAMPVEALAFLVLADFGEQGWNVDSYFKERAQYPESVQVYRQAGVAAALREAWAWLESNALVGGHSTQDSPNARQIWTSPRKVDTGHAACAAVCRAVFSNSSGVCMPRAECRRRWLYRPSIQVMTAARALAWVGQGWR